MTKTYKIAISKVRQRRGMPFIGVWVEGEIKAIGAFYSREDADKAIEAHKKAA